MEKVKARAKTGIWFLSSSSKPDRKRAKGFASDSTMARARRSIVLFTMLAKFALETAMARRIALVIQRALCSHPLERRQGPSRLTGPAKKQFGQPMKSMPRFPRLRWGIRVRGSA